ncbi:FxsA family protein [Magnetospira sp. QH-2]|uniref:FxsA family protein n=1 Tax=Magnetospira sp. (strain QH-2) TaxID=1288970 RepID=UPI0003E80A67|nr:FxsA family protein [Magnetospira sp. QH-2]CCQ75628.1 conserved membrane protein of unknown function, FxsA [Magnetospira sp. QH-2]
MGLLLVFAFLLIPVAEIALFIEVGDGIGLWATLGLVLMTAMVGISIMRMQGQSTFERARQTLDRGDMPVDEALDGVLLILAGALLLTPGFFTDTIGFLLLLPPLRGWLKTLFRTRVDTQQGFWVRGGGFEATGNPHPGSKSAPPGDKVIDGEFEDMTDILEDERPRRDAG